MTAADRLTVQSWEWPEIHVGDDLAALVMQTLPLDDGDVLAVTSKVVSKSEGMQRSDPKPVVVAADSRRIVARRGSTVIAETHDGLVLAAAGVDESNVDDGVCLSLPRDADATARRLRASIAAELGANVAVIVTDTAGRAWRQGQTDIAIGCAGLDPLLDLRGGHDDRGRVLRVTVPAVADEIAGLADLVKGKATGRPIAVVKGLAHLVLEGGQDGPGAHALLRPADDDLFGLGAREAAVASALRSDRSELSHFPRMSPDDADPFTGLATSRRDVALAVVRDQPAATGPAAAAAQWAVHVSIRDDAGDDALIEAGRLIERAFVLAAAHRLDLLPELTSLTAARPGWRTVRGLTWAIA